MTRIAHRWKLVLAVASLAASACAAADRTPLPAGEAAYTRTPGETLRYRSVLTSVYRIGPGRPPPAADADSTVREAQLAIRFAADGRAEARIESLRQQTAGTPPESPGPDALASPFTLAFSAQGIDSVIRAPGFPEGWKGLAEEFTSLLPRLPGGPFTRGRKWEDTATVNESDASSEMEFTREIRYRVAGDSVIGGVPVVVVEYTLEVRGELRVHSAPGMPAAPPYVDTSSHQEEGRFYFAPGAGRLIRLTATGTAERSSSSLTGEPPYKSISEYSSTLELLSAGPA